MLRNDAVERAVYQDIPQSFGVGNPMMLERLLYVLAAQITGVLSPSHICSELGLSLPTLDRYLSCLERALLVVPQVTVAHPGSTSSGVGTLPDRVAHCVGARPTFACDDSASQLARARVEIGVRVGGSPRTETASELDVYRGRGGT